MNINTINYKVEKYQDILKTEFYLDNYKQLRRAKNGYYNRFSIGDLVKPFEGSCGYLYIQIPKVRNTISIASIVYLLEYGLIPKGMDIDHIDGNRKNNHPNNLRLVTRQLNNRNRKKRSDNTSGITGINWSNFHNHYVIRRTINGKRLSRSRKTLEEAIEVLNELRDLGDGYTNRHGK